MPHRQFTAGDTDYIARLNALANSLDRRLAQNILVNGSMQVWQRGTSIAGAATRVYGPDRWSFYRSSAATGMTVSRQTGSDPSRYCARVQRDSGNASTATIKFVQALTTENTYPLRGKRLGLRFRARAGANYSSSASALGAYVVTGTGTDQHPATPYTGASESSPSVTLTTSWQYFAVDLGVIGGSVTEIAFGFVCTPVGTAGANDHFEVEEAQLVPTSDSNVDVGDYPWRSFEEELAACQVYYEKSFPYATAPAQNAGVTGAWNFLQVVGAAATTWAPLSVPFTTRKRAIPTTVTLYNPSAANAEARNLSASNDWSSCSASSGTPSEWGFLVTGTTSAGSAAGHVSGVHWTADAEL